MKQSFRTLIKLSLILVVVSLMTAMTSAPAKSQPRSDFHQSSNLALRLGLGVDPDQFVAGLYGYAGSLSDRVAFMPYADVGIGDDVVAITGNGDFRIALASPENSSIIFYTSVGPTVAFWDSDRTDSDIELGASLSLGITRWRLGSSGPYNAEIRLGFGDIPDAKLLFGFWL